VTVLAPTAAMADALSTAFYLLGPEATGAYVASHPEVGVVIVERGLATVLPRLIVFGLSEHDFAPTENTVK
jgi:FAD:protein FMN transferase